MVDKILPLLLLLCISCAGTKPVPQTDELTRFFQMIETDLDRAGAVIVENNLVRNLTHLQLMDNGGNKYYILERENITRMIRAVTAGVYNDCVIINRDGLIVYTMYDDYLFAKNVLAALSSTPFNGCYVNRNGGNTHVEDVTPWTMPGKDPGFALFVSKKISGGDTFPGILVLQVNSDNVRKLLPRGTSAVGTDGRYRIPVDDADFGKPFGNAAGIDFGAPGNGRYRVFRYANLAWGIVRE